MRSRDLLANGCDIRLKLSGVLICVLAIGCQPVSEVGVQADGGVSSVSQADFPAAFAHAFCTKAFACCTAAEITQEIPFSPPVTTEAECESDVAGVTTLALMGLQPSMTAGRIRFDGAAAKACIDTEANATCSEFATTEAVNSPLACNSMLSGQIALGGVCANNTECVSDYCMGASSQPPTNGTCVAKPTQGQPCPDDVCADGLRCEAVLPTSICSTLKADGAACFYAAECMSKGCNGANPAMALPGACGAPTICNGL